MRSCAFLVVVALLPYFSAGDVCLSPAVDSTVYTTSETTASTQTVVIVEFSITCKNKLKDLNLYAEFNGRSYPASRIEGANKYQVTFTGEHKTIPAGTYSMKFYDEEGYSNLRKAQRSGEDADSVKSLFAIPVNHPGASKGPYIQSEVVATAVGAMVGYLAHCARSKLAN